MPVQFKQATLPNGLNVIAEVDPEAHSAAVGFFVKTGARDEDPRIMGVSHFLEHMMFKGSETRSAEDVDREFDDLGASHNAFTTNEMTAFYAHVLPEHLDPATDILADILRPALRQADFDAEKQVILEEIAMYDDNPFWVLYERTMEVCYGSHPLSHRVLGTPKTVADMARDEMLDYFNRRYSADNTVVALAGRVDFDQMTQRLGEHCGAWSATRAERAHPPLAPNRKEFTMTLDSVTQHYLLMVSPAPALTDDRRYAAAVLGQILGDAEGSRLYWALIETGLAEEAQAQYEGRDDTGEYFVYCSCSPGSAEKVEQVARQEIDRLIDSVTADDLQRISSKIATGATLQSERSDGRMRRLGQVWTYLGTYRPIEEELERINAVTLDDLRSLHEAFPVAPTVVGRLAPS